MPPALTAFTPCKTCAPGFGTPQGSFESAGLPSDSALHLSLCCQHLAAATDKQVGPAPSVFAAPDIAMQSTQASVHVFDHLVMQISTCTLA